MFIITDIGKFLIVHPGFSQTTNNTSEIREATERWSVNNTKLLLDLLRAYRTKVGSSEIKTKKKMWEMLSLHLTRMTKVNITATHCENRWRVVDRNYKKYILNEKNTGSGREHFEYKTEMEALTGKKRSLRPANNVRTNNIDEIKEDPVRVNVVSTKVDSSSVSTSVDTLSVSTSVDTSSESTSVDTSSTKVKNEVQTKNKNKGNVSNMKRKNKRLEILQKMFLSREEYQKKRIEIELMKVAELKRRNDIEQRNVERHCCGCRCSDNN